MSFIDVPFDQKTSKSEYLIKTPEDILKASRCDNLPLLQHLISSSPADINKQDIDGYTALHHAVSNSNIPMVEYIIQKGANPNIRTHYELKTPLHLSLDIYQSYRCSSSLGSNKLIFILKQKYIMIMLLENDAYPFFSDQNGNTFSALLFLSLASKLKELFYKFSWLAPPVKLKTLAAQKIITSGIFETTTNCIPKKLKQFISFHIPLSESPQLRFTEMSSARYAT